MANLLDRDTRKKRDGGHRPSGPYANSGYESVVVRPQIFDRRHQSEIDLIVVQQPRTDGRQVVPNPPSIGCAVESPGQRTGIQVAHRTDTNGHQAMGANRPSRSTGSNPAA